MAATRWKREGKTGGPSNVLDKRWYVIREGDCWFVYDQALGEPKHGTYRTMADAREAAERRAARAGSEAWS